jgi:hypothetical protein
LPDNVRDEVVTVHRSQEVLKMMPLYKQTFLPQAEEVLIYSLKLFCRNICNFPTNSFLQFFRSGVTVVNFILQIAPE